MTEPDPDLVTFAQLNERIGSLFWLWAMVERSLAKARKEQGANDKGSLRATVEAWARHEKNATDRASHHATVRHVRNEMFAAIEVRNHFAHGLRGGSARLHPEDPEARYITCLKEETRTWTYRELKVWMTYLERLDASIGRLTGAAKRCETEVANMYHDIRNQLTEAAPPGRPPPP